MSLNGDVMVIRNGRSTSTVSIYNYPEHLNPFYEDDQHKRLRFWHINKKGDGERRNSFSLGGIKDMWAFKSFRSKKKSSTLGINKTSESPPPLRREYQIDADNLFNSYDRRARYSSNGTATDGGNSSFERNATYRSSLQNVHSTQNPNGFGLNRNDQYRSTIQFGGRSQQSKTNARPVPQPRRYVYGGSVTPQPSRNSEFVRGLTRDSLTRGSSQTSVSTNPFDSDDNDDEEIEQRTGSAGGSSPLAGKRTPRKKRRAPAPPVPIHSTNAAEISSQTKNHHQTELRIEENLEIANLTAEIESFVKTTNDESPERETQKATIRETSNKKEAPKTNGTIPKEKIILRTSPNMVITKEFKPQPKPNNTDLRITEDEHVEVKPALPTKKKINQNIVIINTEKEPSAPEVGHVECIHVHVESPRSTPERTLPSRVTSFKKEQTPPTEHITAKTSFTLASPPTNRREATENGFNKQKVTVKETVTTIKNDADVIHHKENGIVEETPTIVKPPIAAKPAIENSKPKVTQNFAVIHKPSRRVVLSSETEEITTPAPASTTITIVEKTATTERISAPSSPENFNDSNFESTKTQKAKPSNSQKHVVFQTDVIKETDKLPEAIKVEINKMETSGKAMTDTSKSEIKAIEVPSGSQAVKLTTVEATIAPVETTSLKIIEPKEDVLKIEEPISLSSQVPSTSSFTRSSARTTPQTSPRDEFEALYRNRPASHLEWKQSTLAPLEPHVPPEKRRSVKDIIESINRSQRLLHAAAHKDLPLLSTTSQMPPPAYSEVVSQPHVNGNTDNDLDQSLKSLDETQREIERMFEDIAAEDTSDEAPSPSCSRNANGEDFQKPNNEEIFKKCRVTKEVYDYRETSPTTSNLDWNPVPKPKRSKNLSEQREH